MVMRKRMIMCLMAGIVLLSGCGNQKAETKPLGKKQQAEAAAKSTGMPEATVQVTVTPIPPKVKKIMEKTADINNWKKVKGKYRYPITSNELACLDTTEDKYAACEIPRDLLRKLSSMELLELVLDCPMLHYIGYWDSYYQGIYEVARDYNGMQEFMERPDFYKTVVRFYKDMKIPRTKKCNLDAKLPESPTDDDYNEVLQNSELMKQLDKDMKVLHTIRFCETILTSMTDNVDKATIKEAQKVIKQKIREVKNTEFYKEVKKDRWFLKESSYVDKRMVTYF